MTNPELMLKLATEAMEAFESEGQTSVKSGDIREWIKTQYPKEFKRLEPSWANNLLSAQSLDGARIGREPGTYKYVLWEFEEDEGEAEIEEEEEESGEEEEEGEEDEGVEGDTKPSASKKRRKQREKHLYPLLTAWVRAQGFGADDTSANKSGGAWGNPDVTGIRIVEGPLGQKVVEIMTVEVKSSRTNWKREFFEAVSHKRFANRVYFAFAYPSDNPSLEALEVADRNEMRLYGEKFRVGILVVFLPKEAYSHLHAKTGSLPELNADEVRIEELWPALHELPDPLSVSRHLADVLKIGTDSSLHAFAGKLE